MTAAAIVLCPCPDAVAGADGPAVGRLVPLGGRASMRRVGRVAWLVAVQVEQFVRAVKVGALVAFVLHVAGVRL